MPLYLINAVELKQQGPFETKEDVARAAQEVENDDGESIVVEINESGEITSLTGVEEYLNESEAVA